MKQTQDKMRCYHFSNFYLGGIHAGIQSHHSLMEMMIKYKEDSPQKDQLFDWAENNKTVIVLNGGMDFDLRELAMFMQNSDNPYPWATFCEADVALNESITNLGVILPDSLFKMSRVIVSNHPKALAFNGRGDGVKFENVALTIEIVEGGIMVSYDPTKEDYFSLITPSMESPVEPFEGVKDRFYSDFEVEFMARINRCSLM